jgi:DNA-directed RNA polymerase subunit K/omega
VIPRRDELGAFKFAVLAGLRAKQLMRGCTPTVDGGVHKLTVVAQLEVGGGTIGEMSEEAEKA